jgi:eukaryotic-like serine/threonine-protein kinase
MVDEPNDKLQSAFESAHPDADLEADLTKAVVAERLLGLRREPTKIGRFTIVRFVGAGAMGRVFLAYDERLQREVAVKLLATRRSDAARERLEQEARALARLSHPNVVQVYEVGTHDGDPFARVFRVAAA